MSHQQFLEKTRQQLADMRRRSAGKYASSGRMLRAPVACPLELPDYRALVLEWFGSEDGICRCVYCGRPLSVATFVSDHKIALRRPGGSNERSNLAPACSDCNDAKGSLNESAFRILLDAVKQMPPEDARLLMGRLKKSEKLAATARRFRAQFGSKRSTGQAANAVGHEQGDDDF